MEPPVKFTRTSDGVSIAYWTIGEGPPLLIGAPIGACHTRVECRIPTLAAWYEHLARRFTVVRWDWRGSGLSDRDVEISAETGELDIDAVMTAEGFSQPAAIVPSGGMNEWIVRFAAHRPGIIDPLVLISPTMSGRDAAWTSSQSTAVRSLLQLDFSAWSEAHARNTLGWKLDDPRIHAWAGVIRASRNQADWIRFAEMLDRIDLTDVLPNLAADVLIINISRFEGALRRSREVASHIERSRFIDIDHGSALAWYEKSEVGAAIDEFLAPRVGVATEVAAEPTGTAIILFMDIADSTGLTERLGDEAFRAAADEMEETLRRTIRDAGGAAVEGKLLGDGVLATFTSAREAIQAALRCRNAGPDALTLHIGLHAGDVIRQHDNVYGGAVNIASRICGLCAPGEALVSQTVRDLARTSAGVTFEDRGEHELKGIADPVRVFAVTRTPV
jgi:class 3 adenylate cyclase